MLAIARAVMSMGAFVAIGALWSLAYVAPGSAEFVVAVTSVVIGAGLVAMAVILARRDLRRVFHKEDQ
ncbi:MAG: hypothetical protein ACR2LI_10380 [Propionibacteriaceae bacterium]